ncbi:hypothetical protein NKI20_29425 [Mesorhizobium sp. M0830]|uniref:hypothetical protein n=1 Tax=Mesorhizobium sp. M0830 TaxID=2957008 RepID=UPI00333B2733
MAMVDWKGQNVQLVWFLADVDGVSAAEIFRRIWDEEPEQAHNNRVPNPSNPFLSLASSIDDGVQSQVQVQPGRVDVVISTDIPNESANVFGALFDLEERLNFLLNRNETVSIISKDAFRIALVATSMKPVESYSDGVKEFISALGFDFGIANATDLMFQINSRFSLGDIIANRLVQLSTVGFQSFAFPLAPGSVLPHLSTSTIPAQFVARRHFDFNTVPDGKLLERDKLRHIFRGLADELLRVIAVGNLSGLRN